MTNNFINKQTGCNIRKVWNGRQVGRRLQGWEIHMLSQNGRFTG